MKNFNNQILVITFFLFCQLAFSQRDKDEKDPLFTSAYNKFEKGEYKDSYNEYTEYLAKKPNDNNALYNRGLCAYEMKDYKDGITNFSKSIYSGRKKHDAFYSRGLCNYKLKNYKIAIADFDTAITIKTNYSNRNKSIQIC